MIAEVTFPGTCLRVAVHISFGGYVVLIDLGDDLRFLSVDFFMGVG